MVIHPFHVDTISECHINQVCGVWILLTLYMKLVSKVMIFLRIPVEFKRLIPLLILLS